MAKAIQTWNIHMKTLKHTLTILFLLVLVNVVKAQVLEKKAFKEATTIRLYVSDATKNAAIARFTDFINKTSWTVQPTENGTAVGDTSQSVDTIRTDTGSLFDVMMGEFQGQLVFYADRDSSDKLYIAVSGYASTTSWGGSDKLKMKKGGENSNWSQRAMFKQMNKHLLSYSGVNQRLYSDE